jgi:Ca-activated chloride channel family protein
MRYLRLLALLLCLPVFDVAAQGIVLDRILVEPSPPRPTVRRRLRIRLKEHRIQIRIQDQVARTDVIHVFHNPNPWPMEGIYLFPLPKDAALSEFSMRMGDKQIPGEILDANRAREIYRSIVHRRRDPGLLEFAGRGLIRARLFPIPARGDTKITLAFGQVLTPDGGMLELRYPMRSDKFAPGAVRISGEVEIRSAVGVANVFSPSHGMDVVRKSKDHVIASFEEGRSAADRDFRLLYGLGRKAFGLSLTTHKPRADDGYFLMLLAPNTEVDPSAALKKDIVFVLDTSGSMGDRGGTKMKQAKAALTYALGRLDRGDRFNIVAFATEARPFRERIVDASEENVAAALDYVQGLQATGGTAIHDALVEALGLERATGRVPIVIFLTDGQPTIGPTDVKTILNAASRSNRAGARLFVFGVGDDVNATLLTELADQNRGTGNFVSERENIEIKVSSLYDKVASPVLTDVSIRLEDVGEYDVYPRDPGDLFKGQQLVVVGRYRKQGPRAVTLRGRVGEKEVSFVYEATFGGGRDRDYLPRLWAVRKVGFLLSEIRRNGERGELVSEIRRLGTRYGIVTPYTSFLVLEESEMLRRRLRDLPAEPGGAPAPTARALRSEIRALEEAMDEAEAAGDALRRSKAVGRGAVAGARQAESYKYAESGPEHAGKGVKTAGGKTFRYTEGVWVDIDLDALLRGNPGAKVVRVKYLSEAYDALLTDDTLARYLSVGPRLRLAYGQKVYEIFE